MPSKPGFLLQDARDAAAAWARTVGEMGRAEGPQRIGARAYNRRRPLRAKSARPRMKAESPGGAPKGPRREEGPHHQARRQVRRNNRRLHRATRDAFAAGEWGTTVRRAMRRWLASLVGSQKARSSPGNNELRGRYGIGFRRRGKKTTLQSGPAGCTARGQERGSQQQREQQRAASASKRQRWETQRQHPNRRRRTQTTLASQKRRTAIRASHLWRRERAELPFQGEPFLSALLPGRPAGAAARSLSSQSRRAAAERGSDLQEQNGRAARRRQWLRLYALKVRRPAFICRSHVPSQSEKKIARALCPPTRLQNRAGNRRGPWPTRCAGRRCLVRPLARLVLKRRF
ncbi:hypothetical protein, conserved in T.vivax [Trypanosoma vivax Y486]|uniref:Uncharacterized protein n=1 Tax=Trypanosoma vivax (strain Y486) TaxID=1055687 RepID=F9WNE9_TRYVY|nr:hypothetical protein, conserved in T.vivax [Trypanosoma vivax Y486]|eukprot:CCD19067.1 hypothetical protein, conserved in T.vivax [Trypanosoma vivax Y486]